MARGWESKSVEDQIGAAEAEREAQQKRTTTPQERERESRKQSLLLSRAGVLSRLETASTLRYRAQLERALEHLDGQLREFEKPT